MSSPSSCLDRLVGVSPVEGLGESSSSESRNCDAEKGVTKVTQKRSMLTQHMTFMLNITLLLNTIIHISSTFCRYSPNVLSMCAAKYKIYRYNMYNNIYLKTTGDVPVGERFSRCNLICLSRCSMASALLEEGLYTIPLSSSIMNGDVFETVDTDTINVTA